jgi:metal-responsive CopG/Arc/MetJ family transcriptional regulator
MAVRKIAISVPEEVLRQVDRLARKSKTTRSGLITRVLREVSDASNQAEVTERINHLFNDQDLIDEQASTAHTFLQAAENDEDSGW